MREPPLRKKPWYLIAALLGALAYGVDGSCDGLRETAIPKDPSAQITSDPVLRAQLADAFERYLQHLDMAKNRTFPFAVAAILLGGAMMLFAFRAMAGRGQARSALVQLAVVQAGVAIASFVVLRDVRYARLDFNRAAYEVQVREAPNKDRAARSVSLLVKAERVAAPVSLGLHTLGSLLIVFALTRPRSRAFFEAPADPVREQ